MRLSTHTDYALRVLMLVALEPNERHTIAVVAKRYDISRNHLMKVVQTLTQTGILESTRGRGGGLRLSRPATSIRIGDVVRATESDFAMVECFDPARSRCVISPACGLRHVLAEARDAFLNTLNRYTLAELLGSPQSMRNLLQLTA